MGIRGIAALRAGLLLVATLANASSLKETMRIKVLDSETRSSSLDNNGVPKNCDQVTFDAYCRSSATVPQVSTLLVQEGNEPPFHIACTIYSKYSRCTPLPKGESFDAKREKHGITVYYVDDKGKTRKQLYALVDADEKIHPQATAAMSATPPPVPEAVASPQSSAVLPPAPTAPPTLEIQSAKAEKVKCNFASTPAGAEITLDGKYVGSTPSEIGLGPGTHAIVLFVPGFALWKRDLTVLPGSELTVSAVLQKQSQ
ncbi:MAG: PEGA domain-containing protein [Candidatus Sulfotelmatobacter sp.]